MPNMTIKIVKEKISQNELEQLARDTFVNMIKGVVDIDQKIIALGGEMHADAERALLEQGSQQESLWGFNLFLQKSKDERLVYESLINIRPWQNNLSTLVQDEKLKQAMRNLIDGLVE